MRRYLQVLVLLTLVAALGFASGQEEQAADEQDEIVTLTYWDENAGPDRTPYYEELLSRFMEEHPNIRVEYVGLPWSGARQRYEVAIASDDLPDVGGLAEGWIASFSQRGVLLPLDERMQESGLDEKIGSVYKDQIRNLSSDGRLYMVPHSANSPTIWYRQDWFEEAGIEPPESYEEWFDAVRQLRDPDQNRYGFSIRGGSGGSYNLLDLVATYSGETEFVDERGNSILDDPELIDFVDRYFALYNDYTPEADITLGYRGMISHFTTGLVGMIHHNLGSQPSHAEAFEEDQFANMPLPQGPHGGGPVAFVSSIGRGMFRGTEHPEEAWTLLRWLSEAEAQSYFNEQIGQIPTHADAADDEWVQNAEHIQVMVESLSHPDARPYSRPTKYPDWPDIQENILSPGLQAVMAGDRTAEDFMLEWHEAMEEAHEVWEQQQN